jgi:signal transduction histidine kinase
MVVCFGISVYAFLFDRSHAVPYLAEALLALALVYAVWVVVSEPYRRYSIFASAWAITVADTVLTMLWLYATGGIDSPFFVALYLAIVGIAYRFSLVEALATSAIYAAGYLVLAIITDQLSARFTDIFVRVVYLGFTGMLSGTFARHLLRQGVEITEHQRAEKERARFIEGVISAQDEERRRIARELHDETGQSLASLVVGLRALEERSREEQTRAQASHLQGIATSTIEEVGRLARGLHPSVLDDLGFAAAVGRYTEELMRAHPVRVDLHVRGVEPRDKLPRVVATSLYRILQEALTNVTRHAAAKTASVVVDCGDTQVRAVIEDDGCGFDAEAVLADLSQTGRLGLQSMRERVALLKGSLTVDSTPGEGTTVAVTLPLNA